jgi:hypothetical protein
VFVAIFAYRKRRLRQERLDAEERAAAGDHVQAPA